MIATIKLDGITIRETPANIKELEEIIELDKSLKTWVQRFNDVSLTYYGDGFKYIKGLKDQFGYNKRIEVEISISEDTGLSGIGDVIRGFHYLTDIEIQHTDDYVKVPLIEVFFEGTLKQNQNVEVTLIGATSSLNGVDISTYTPLSTDLELYDPEDGTYQGVTNLSVNAVTALRFIVAYISDDTVGFRDDYFTATWGANMFNLATGYELRTHDGTSYPKASFNYLITNLYKNFNVWYYIDYSTFKPQLVLDTYQNILAKAGTVGFEAVRRIKESFYEDNFYNVVEIGSRTQQDPVTVDDYWLKFFNGFTFHFEKYEAKNNTMINRTLDLITELVIDHNVITRLIKLNVTDYDNQLFMIESEFGGLGMNPAKQYTYTQLQSSTAFKYNENLLNYNRLVRFDLPIDLGITNPGTVNDNFLANLGADIFDTISASFPLTLIPTPYDNEVSDPNNNYDPALYRYYFPVDGTYGFYASIRAIVTNMPDPGIGSVTCFARIVHKYNDGTVRGIKVKNFTETNNSGADGFLFYIDGSFAGGVGDYVEIQWHISSGLFVGTTDTTYDLQIVGAESEFKTLFVQNQGGIIAPLAAIRTYYGSKLEMDKFIGLTQWKSLKNDLVQDITVTKGDGKLAIGKVSRIARNIMTGKSKIELIGKSDKIGL